MDEGTESRDRNAVMEANMLLFGAAAANAKLYTVLTVALDGIPDELLRARTAASVFEKTVVDESVLCWAADHFEKSGGEAKDRYAVALAMACASRVAAGMAMSFAHQRTDLGNKSLCEIVSSITCEMTRDEVLGVLLAAYAGAGDATAYGTVLAVYGKPVDPQQLAALLRPSAPQE